MQDFRQSYVGDWPSVSSEEIMLIDPLFPTYDALFTPVCPSEDWHIPDEVINRK